VFEAAGVGACLVTDAWEGIADFLQPEREVLVADDGAAVAAYVRDVDRARATEIGHAARERMLGAHTYAHRAEQFDALLRRPRP
jgi:spore maturation protein CgeB